MNTKLCVCGHAKGVHPTKPDAGFACLSDLIGGERRFRPCQCEGWQLPVARGRKPVFGIDRLPRVVAERAPAWPPLPPQAR